MGCLVVENKADLDFPELRESSLKVIGTFVASGDMNIVNRVIEGISQIIESENPWHRQATVLLFSALCEYKDLHQIQSYLERGFDAMFKLVTDKDILVVKNSLIGFITIAEFFPSHFYTHANINTITYTLLELMSSNDSRIIESSLNVIRYITEGLVQNKNDQSPLASEPSILLQPMVSYFNNQLENFEKEKEKDNREKAVIIIMNCLMKSKDRKIASHLITFLMDRYHEVCNYNHLDREMMIESILAIMHTAILALEGSMINQGLQEQIFHLISFHMSKFGIEAEGLNIISSIAIVYSTSLRNNIDEYWNYILHGTESIHNHKTFKAALHCAGDFGRTYKEKLFDK